MGPNGSGKSTLASVLAGNPKFEVTRGSILFKGNDLLEMEPEDRARGTLPQFPVPSGDTRCEHGQFYARRCKRAAQI